METTVKCRRATNGRLLIVHTYPLTETEKFAFEGMDTGRIISYVRSREKGISKAVSQGAKRSTKAT